MQTSYALSSDVMQYFCRDLSKDHRSLNQPDIVRGGVFYKHFLDPQAAANEFAILSYLSAAQQSVPEPIAVEGHRLLMREVQGIRLYDLLRTLRILASENTALAKRSQAVRDLLLQRATEQLAKLQTHLSALRTQMSHTRTQMSAPVYSFDTKVTELIHCLLTLAGSPPMTAALANELQQMRDYWHRECCLIPFRDATAKNSLVVIPELSLTASFMGSRLTRLRQLFNSFQCAFRRL